MNVAKKEPEWTERAHSSMSQGESACPGQRDGQIIMKWKT